MDLPCRKVVVVEDDFLLRLDLALYLEDEGLEVIAAGTADEIMDILPEAQPVDLVVTDVQMPGSVDGLTLAAYVASRWPQTHVIVASAVDLEPEQLPPGALYVQKPYGPYDVSRIIDQICF